MGRIVLHSNGSLLVQGIARRLIEAALHEAAKKREMRYSDLQKIEGGVRRHFHDDITVIVLFFNPHLIDLVCPSGGPLSKHGLQAKFHTLSFNFYSLSMKAYSPIFI